MSVGIDGYYKVGHWTPFRVTVAGVASLDGALVKVIAPDSDGVDTVSSALLRPSERPGGTRTADVYTKVGRKNATIRLVLADDAGDLDSLLLSPGTDSPVADDLVETPTTGELICVVSSSSLNLAGAYKQSAEVGMVKRVVAVREASGLPEAWFGYDAVDVLILSLDDGELWRNFAGDEERLAAIVEWVELGGRLVLMVGGDSAQAAFRDGRGLAKLLPGEFADVVTLPETGRLEQFANSEAPIAGRGARAVMRVPRLAEVEGDIEVFAGRRPADLPIVVRSARGLGEITYVGLDFNKPPLVEWPGRDSFLQALLEPYVAERAAASAPNTLVTRGYNDLAGALRQSLGRVFPGLAPVTFSTVTIAAIAYLLVLGPIDYYLVHRWLRRPMAAWITFPLFVLLFTGAALAVASWRKGDGGPRVNYFELVDVDASTGRVRGTCWSSLYNPRAARFDLRLEVRPLDQRVSPNALVSAWGLPGGGIGGTQSGGMNLGIVRDAYQYLPGFVGLADMPVLTSATKSLFATWTAMAEPPIEADLAEVDGLAAGTIENRTGFALRNVRLLYNGWGYQLGTLEPGGQADVGERLSPLRVKTIVSRSALGPSSRGDAEANLFRPENASPAEIVNLMMFYEAAGGRAFGQLPNEYQDEIDFSRLLELGRAVLIAEADAPGSRFVDTESGAAIGEGHESPVVYRFVLPVQTD